jgi:pSer/pThr/pTyr-binding forkhead associated (FHA) protein
MRDGLTEKMKARRQRTDLHEYLGEYRPKLVVLSGRDAGMEYPIDRERCIIGRGPGVDFPFDDSAMSRQHAAVDFAAGVFRIQDLGSTNGLRVNGNPVQSCEIEHGDRIEVGSLGFQFVIDELEDSPNTYELTAEI